MVVFIRIGELFQAQGDVVLFITIFFRLSLVSLFGYAFIYQKVEELVQACLKAVIFLLKLIDLVLMEDCLALIEGSERGYYLINFLLRELDFLQVFHYWLEQVFFSYPYFFTNAFSVGATIVDVTPFLDFRADSATTVRAVDEPSESVRFHGHLAAFFVIAIEHDLHSLKKLSRNKGRIFVRILLTFGGHYSHVKLIP